MTKEDTAIEATEIIKTQGQVLTHGERIRAVITKQNASLLPLLSGNEQRYNKLTAAFAFSVVELGLQGCDIASMIKAFKKCCELDLEPGNGLGKVYLIKYGSAINAQIGYKGYLELLMRRTDIISNVYTGIVYEGDEWYEERGNTVICKHVPKYESRELRLTYAIVKFKNGDIQLEVATKQDIEESKALSKSSSYGASPWKMHYNSMAKIVPLRKLITNLGISITIDDEFVPAEQAQSILKVVRQEQDDAA